MINTRPRVALFQPRIPQNTGNIGRSCIAFNMKLDLIKPLGFDINDTHLKRAGLDYWKHVDVSIYESFDHYLSSMSNFRIIAFSKKSNQSISNFKFANNDILLFGREDNGLPSEVLSQCSGYLSIPMPGKESPENIKGVRSLNLAVACGIVIYTVCDKLDLL